MKKTLVTARARQNNPKIYMKFRVEISLINYEEILYISLCSENPNHGGFMVVLDSKLVLVSEDLS